MPQLWVKLIGESKGIRLEADLPLNAFLAAALRDGYFMSNGRAYPTARFEFVEHYLDQDAPTKTVARKLPSR